MREEGGANCYTMNIIVAHKYKTTTIENHPVLYKGKGFDSLNFWKASTQCMCLNCFVYLCIHAYFPAV